MKILIVNRFFGGAQIPTGRMAEDVARVLVEGGHEVTALASSGEYDGAARSAVGIRHTASGIQLEQVRIPKWMPRALAWLWFTWQARKQIPRMEWDVCVLMTDPPLLPLLVPRAKAAGGQGTGNRGQSESSAYALAEANDSGVTTKRRVAVWLMDLYPEALAASRRLSARNPIYRWYFEKRQRALAASDLLLFLGETQKARGQGTGDRPSSAESLRVGEGQGESGERKQGTGGRGQGAVGTETLNHRNTEPPGALGVRTVVVPPWDDRGNIALATEESLRNLALYAGNLGEAHCFEEILAAAPFLPGDWKIRFAVRGAKFAELKEKASGIRHTAYGMREEGTGDSRQEPEAGRPEMGRRCDQTVNRKDINSREKAQDDLQTTDLKLKTAGASVEVTGYASEEETPGLLASARVHLITMSPGWEGIVVPSKLYGCIRTGRPVLFIGPENADTGREICANDWGMVLPPGSSGEKVAGAILELAARVTKAVRPQPGAADAAKSIQALGDE